MRYEESMWHLQETFAHEPADDVTLKEMETVFKEVHPGNYHLEWGQGQPRTVDLCFDTNEDRTLFLLKYA
jgi:hypothetical protein